jgi:hypothetical protein
MHFESKGLFGSVAINWMAVDSHFFSGCPMFGSVAGGYPDSGNMPKKTG